jgi:hypothetical protein
MGEKGELHATRLRPAFSCAAVPGGRAAHA